MLAAYDAQCGAELVEVQTVAADGARFFENLDRYAGHHVDSFVRLLENRRSSLLHRVPPRAYLGLTSMAGAVRGLAAPARRALRSARRLCRPA